MGKTPRLGPEREAEPAGKSLVAPEPQITLTIASPKQQIIVARFGGLAMPVHSEADGFTRLHRLFTFHPGVAVSLSWMTSLYAALYAPWVRNIRPLIDPNASGPVESTWSFLFAMPVVLTVSWLMVIFGRDLLRQVRLLRHEAAEFAIAGAAAFLVFYISIDRAVAALMLGV